MERELREAKERFLALIEDALTTAVDTRLDVRYAGAKLQEVLEELYSDNYVYIFELMGVTVEPMDASAEARMRATLSASNMEAVPLERAPKVAIYTPPNSTPWDDAVTMALEYAEIPYETIWDYDVVESPTLKKSSTTE